MNRIIIITTFLFVTFSYSQNQKEIASDSIYIKEFTCLFGTQKALSDFQKGQYNCYSFGLNYTSDKYWNEFYSDFIERKYGIILKDGGCVITASSKCYSRTMNDLICEKFGDDIFEKAQKEAKELYKKTE